MKAISDSQKRNNLRNTTRNIPFTTFTSHIVNDSHRGFETMTIVNWKNTSSE